MDNNRNKFFIYLLIACLLVACQANDKTIKPEATLEIFNINIDSSCYGTLEFASGATVDDCIEAYEIASDSLFIITDRHGNKMAAYGPLTIEANQYVIFDEPICVKDFEGYEYRFERDVLTVSDEYLCD